MQELLYKRDVINALRKHKHELGNYKEVAAIVRALEPVKKQNDTVLKAYAYETLEGISVIGWFYKLSEAKTCFQKLFNVPYLCVRVKRQQWADEFGDTRVIPKSMRSLKTLTFDEFLNK